MTCKNCKHWNTKGLELANKGELVLGHCKTGAIRYYNETCKEFEDKNIVDEILNLFGGNFGKKPKIF